MVGLDGIIRSSMFFPVVGVLACSSYDNRQNGNSDDVDVDDSGTGLTYNSPEITSSLTATAYVDEEFSYAITFVQDSTGTGGGLSCSFDAPFDFDKDVCTLIYTPTESDLDKSLYNIELKISDENGDDKEMLELVVVDSSTNTAPEIMTTSLDSATVNTEYSTTISAADAEGDSLTYSLENAPSWLSINQYSGKLSGIPTSHGNETVEVKVTDAGELSDTATYSLLVASVASLEMYVYNAGGSAIGGDAVDDACNVEVILTNTSSGYSVSATAVSGIASFSLDETGTYDIEVPSTNSGSNCYGGFAQDQWLDVSSGSNTSWVHLIPEDQQSEVQSVVGSQITTYRDGSAWTCDSVTDLVKYMSGVWRSSPYVPRAWNSSIRDGTYDLEIDTIDFENNGIQYNEGLLLAISYLDGHLAPSVVQVASGGDVWFTRGSEWSLEDVNYDGTGYTITDAEIWYTAVGSSGDEYTIATDFSHEIIHALIGAQHTNVDEYIMDSSPTVDKPHEQELLVIRAFNNIGPESPTGSRVDLYNGYLE